MSADKDGTEMDEARQARKRAEEMLAEVEAQRPEIDDLSERSSWLYYQNSFSAMLTHTIGHSA